MDHRLIEALAESLVPVIRDAVPTLVKAETAPLIARIAELEAREPEKGEPGASVTVDDVRPLILEAVAALPPAEPGKSVTVDDVRPVLTELVDAIPKPKEITLDDVRPLIEEAVKAIPPAEPGKSVTLDDVRPLIDDAVKALPPAEPGRSLTPEDVRPLLKEMVDALPKPKDGEDGKDGELAFAPDEIAADVAKAISLLAESLPVVSKTPPIILNIGGATKRSKTITTRRDKDGNLVADVHEIG